MDELIYPVHRAPLDSHHDTLILSCIMINHEFLIASIENDRIPVTTNTYFQAYPVLDMFCAISLPMNLLLIATSRRWRRSLILCRNQYCIVPVMVIV